MVSIYTQVYNTRPYLSRCIESVLEQTYQDFEYVLIDNGSTDGCKELLERYAAQDTRIRLIRFEENRATPIFWLSIAQETAKGQYIANLDSDDWWEPNYLESLIHFLEKKHLDLAITGTVNYFEETKRSQVMRKLDTPVVLSSVQFAEYYPQLWTFSSTNWANIMRTELFQKAEFAEVLAANLSNAGDTASMLKYMEHCKRIGIDSTALYHYRIRSKQISRQYSPRRFDSNVYCNNAILHFLELHHTFDLSKQKWLKLVYLNLTNVTLQLLSESKLSGDDKIAECKRIVAHPLTSSALDYDGLERGQWFQTAWKIALNAAEDNTFADTAALRSVLAVLAPRCGSVLTMEIFPLFMRERYLMNALQKDDPDALVSLLLDLIAAKRYTEQYDLGGIVCQLAADKLLLCELRDTEFLREYRNIYWMVWQGNSLEALDQMTGMLLENQVSSSEETFLQLYLSIAAYLGQAQAFVFGKIQLAKGYLRKGAPDECRTILEELEEMGVEDNEELMEMRQELERCGPAHISAECGDVRKLVRLIEKQQQTIDALSQQVLQLTESQREWQRQLAEKMQALIRIGGEGKNTAEETMWAEIFNNTVSESKWLTNKAFSPGRWAVGYSYLYAMYRVLNETRPKRILELGLGQSTRMLAQYAAHYPEVKHVVVEHDPDWISFFKQSYDVPRQTQIVRLDRKMTSYKEAANVRVFDKFKETFAGQAFDFISIDAPLSGDMTQYGRIDVLGLLPDCLSKDFVIMMDDVQRAADARTAMEIQNKLKSSRIPFAAGVYGGTSTCILICAQHKSFLTTM